VEQLECIAVDGSSDRRWQGRFPWQDELRRRNRQFFGISTFRGSQEAIINASLSGEDVFVLMPTGRCARLGGGGRLGGVGGWSQQKCARHGVQ
jgi:hypothetical protein